MPKLTEIIFGSGTDEIFVEETMNKPYPPTKVKSVRPVSVPVAIKIEEIDGCSAIRDEQMPDEANAYMVGNPRDVSNLPPDVAVIQYYKAEY